MSATSVVATNSGKRPESYRLEQKPQSVLPEVKGIRWLANERTQSRETTKQDAKNTLTSIRPGPRTRAALIAARAPA
jgi:hypothetical protein